MKVITEGPRQTPVRRTTDVLVVGGGSAGLAAATSAARLGADVLLVEKNGYLGGTLAMVTLGSICGLYTVTEDDITPVVKGFASELIDRMDRIGGVKGPMRWLKTASLLYDPSAIKIVADEIITEAGVRVAFHNLAVAVVKDGARVQGIIFEGREGRWACMATTVIDCTGNADIAALSGASFEHDPSVNQAPTTMFRLGGVDTARATTMTRDDLRNHLETAVSTGLQLPRTAGGMFSIHEGMMHLNITRVMLGERSPDPLNTDEVTAAEIQGRQQVKLYLDAFRRFVPGYENAFVADIGSELGVRESRRVKGDYWLTIDDVLNEARFEDAIACSAWPVEEHGAGRGTKWVFLRPGTFYELPLRMLVPGGLDGLLVAGRCASASHDAHASMRVSAVCMALGEAAGVAAVQAGESNIRRLDAARIRRQLEKQNAIVGPLP